MNLNNGEKISLDGKLQTVINSLNVYNNAASKNQLNSFINEINAQTGKKITQSQAAYTNIPKHHQFNIINCKTKSRK